MELLTGYKRFKRALVHPDPTAFTGLIHFGYQHYALGDLLTMEVNMAVMALQRNRENVDLIVGVDPGKPSAKYQAFINTENYLTYLDNIYPAFLCAPMLRSLRLIRDRLTYCFMVASYIQSDVPIWPTLRDELEMRQEYPLHHDHINAFYKDNGYLPKLNAPRGYESWADDFVARNFKDRVIVVINPRQSSLAPVPAVTYRDAVMPMWYAFLDRAAEMHPEAIFVFVGGYPEYEYRTAKLRNVYTTRSNGLTLAHELALLHRADMFLGTSSGFATFVTFSDVPYAILNVEHFFADYVGVKVGDEHYPFAREDQILTWEHEDFGSLCASFDRVYATLDVKEILGGRRRTRIAQATTIGADAR